jgi:hypothetical protein
MLGDHPPRYGPWSETSGPLIRHAARRPGRTKGLAARKPGRPKEKSVLNQTGTYVDNADSGACWSRRSLDSDTRIAALFSCAGHVGGDGLSLVLCVVSEFGRR